MAPARVFVLVANRARPDPSIPLDDLPGQGGRFDLVARFVNAALLTSHGIREDAQAVVLFARSGEEPTALRVSGDAVTGVGPDERSTAARLLAALEATPMPVWQAVADGIEVRAGGLEAVLADAPEPVVLLHRDGQPLGDVEEGTFVVGDHEGFTPEQLEALRKRADRVASLGAQALQADQVAAVLHHELDGAGQP